MTYSVSYFKELVEQFSTWSTLRSYLESYAGGKLRIIECGSDLFLIRYDKGQSNFNVPSTAWFRSVVWDAAAHRPLCVAPPKAQEGPLPEEGDLSYEEFYEGVMINAFLKDGQVHLATRSKLDATGTFYSARSFQSLLMDTGMTLDRIQAFLTETGSLFVSLLLQHPEHRLVSRITEPKAIIIHTGSVAQTGVVTFVNHVEPLIKPTDLPLDLWARQLAEKNGWQHQGLVVKKGSERYRIRSSAYTMVRTLRGDSPRLDVRFLKLRQQRMLETYVFYYPEEKELIDQYELLVRQLTQQLYNFYVCVHIKHSIKFADLPPQWKTHIFALHSYYLGNLKGQGFFIRKQEVVQYMNNLPIPRVLHLFKQHLMPSRLPLMPPSSMPPSSDEAPSLA
jgi:hypothetical protein